MTRHRWSDKTVISPNKSERECLNGCGMVKVTCHQSEGGFSKDWTEFYHGLDKYERAGQRPCCGRGKAATYDARNYPL